MRIAVIKRELCRAPKDCNYICKKVCPLEKSGITVIKINEEDKKPNIIESLCRGCGICVKKCPYNAIKIVNVPEILKEDLVHSYGENMFKLFRLPIPQEGCVCIIGENGLGKSTSLKILSGEIIPNFGKDQISKDEVIRKFRGTELQKYFSLLYTGKIKVSFKEQNIEKYRSEIKIKDFLKESTIEYFGFKDIKDKKLSELSGGKLQKVIIAKKIEENADFYFLDEPTAFLDIKERLNLVKILSEFSQNKRIMLVDHDLMFIDAVSSLSHILYGDPGIYGVVSYPLSAKEGINQFLLGYIKRENVRIRDKEILFEVKELERGEKKEKIIEWKNLKAKIGDFELYTECGEIYNKEIVGVIGENSIGKTTFARILAGEIDKISGEISRNIKIAYKPQYIYTDSKKLVEEVIRDVGKEKIHMDFYKNHLINALGIKRLYKKRLCDLSGGELQKVAIAITLLRDVDLYILDEPSAFLDIEMRLRLGKIIRDIVEIENKAALVIDHDLLFISIITDRIIVFDGIPEKKGIVRKPTSIKEGLNFFLSKVGITVRRDEITKRPRINKPNSYLDRKQKEKGIYFED